MHLACSNGHDKVVQVLLDHGVQVDVQDKVNNISCVYFKWITQQKLIMLLWSNNRKTQMNLIMCLWKYQVSYKVTDGIILTTMYL